MHIHAAQASALGNALAGAQDAETTLSMRRARELRDAALRLKAASLEVYTNIPQNPETDSEAVAMISAWSGSQSGQDHASRQLNPSVAERSSADLRQQNPSPQIQEVQRTPPNSPVSYWA
jgi:hypothetical protein